MAGDTKIPSVMYYSKEGEVVAAGAEAETSETLVKAEDEGWTRVELYVAIIYVSRPTYLKGYAGSSFG